MSLVQRLADGGWKGLASGKHYYGPRDCEESADAQERQIARGKLSHSLLPDNVKPGDSRWIHWKVQEEALSNVERAQAIDASIAFQEFAAANPSYPVGSSEAAAQLTEYLALSGVPIVQFNGGPVALATTPEQWQAAYEWKISMGTMPLDVDAGTRAKLEEIADRAYKARMNPTSEDDLYHMPMETLKKLAGAVEDDHARGPAQGSGIRNRF
jgi:hypothetical protein